MALLTPSSVGHSLTWMPRGYTSSCKTRGWGWWGQEVAKHRLTLGSMLPMKVASVIFERLVGAAYSFCPCGLPSGPLHKWCYGIRCVSFAGHRDPLRLPEGVSTSWTTGRHPAGFCWAGTDTEVGKKGELPAGRVRGLGMQEERKSNALSPSLDGQGMWLG